MFSQTATTLNFTEISAPYPSMAGTADGLEQDGGGGGITTNKSAFMEIQQQGLSGMPHAQPYPIRSTYSSQPSQHEAVFATAAAQHPRPLGAYPFPMNNAPLNSSLHNTYSHASHHYLSTYPANVPGVPPCSSPPREGKLTFIIVCQAHDNYPMS